jgi:hypothetical protein
MEPNFLLIDFETSPTSRWLDLSFMPSIIRHFDLGTFSESGIQ